MLLYFDPQAVWQARAGSVVLGSFIDVVTGRARGTRVADIAALRWPPGKKTTDILLLVQWER